MIQRKKFNITILGESMVGKTSIIKCLKNNEFKDEGILTAGIDSYLDEAVLDGKKYKFKIFDTAGQERFRSISNTTIKFSEGFMVIFSVIDKDSFQKIGDWIESIKETVEISTKSIYLIGNKIDAPNRVVLNEEAVEYAKNNNLKYFWEYDIYLTSLKIPHLHHSIYNFTRNYTIFQMKPSNLYKNEFIIPIIPLPPFEIDTFGLSLTN